MEAFDKLGVSVSALKTNSAVRIRRPVRADVHSMLRSLFQVEEHAASENAQERRASECRKNCACGKGDPNYVAQYSEDGAKDGTAQYDEWRPATKRRVIHQIVKCLVFD